MKSSGELGPYQILSILIAQYIAVGVSIFLTCFHQRKHKRHIAQQQKFVRRQLTLL